MNRLFPLSVVVALGASATTALGAPITVVRNVARAEEPAPAPFVVTAASLREKLLTANTQILLGFNRLYRAKEQVRQARAALLPSLDARAALGSIASPGFALSAIDILLPFLSPANWFQARQAREILSAEKHAFRLIELNQFASAYALYATVLNDIEVRRIHETRLTQLREILRVIETQHATIGNIPDEDLHQARAQVALGESRVRGLDGLLEQDRAAFRQLLGLPIGQSVEFTPLAVPALALEAAPPAQIFAEAQGVSPELQQLHDLRAATRQGRWAAVFSFFGQGSLSLATYVDGSAGSVSQAFANAPVTASGQIGFGYASQIRLSDNSLAEIELRVLEQGRESARLAESVPAVLRAALDQLAFARTAEAEMSETYLIRLRKYALGMGSLLEALIAQTQVTEASIARAGAEFEVNQQRITLHRMLITDEFAKVAGCRGNLDDLPRTRRARRHHFESIQETCRN